MHELAMEVTELNMQRKWEITHFLERCVKYLFPCILNSNAPTTSSQSVMTSSRDDQLVHQLWPPEDVVCSTNFDVVLFHGLQWPGEMDSWMSTWVQRNDPTNCWAQNWLPQDLGENVRVLALSYDSCVVQCGNQGNIDGVSGIAHNILQNLVFSDRWELGKQRKFVMIGHCFGGLVLKSLMVEARKIAKRKPRNMLDMKNAASAKTFLKNLRGVAFYAVPHFGSELELNFTQFYSTWLDSGAEWAGIMQILKDNQKMAELSQTCEDIIDEFSINVFAFLEGTPTEEMKCKLVGNIGAQSLARRNYIILEYCDHFTVCKPPDKEHPSYHKLLEFIKTCRAQKEKQIYCGRPSWQLSYYVESSLIKKLLKSLMDKESKHILVHGPYGSGTTTLVEYVLQTYANVLRDHFFGGIFKLECGPDDYDNIRLIASQKDLLQQLASGDHEISRLESMSIMTIKSMLQEQLNMCPGPWLLFIDNVWSVKSISQLPVPNDESCKLVITSRFELTKFDATRIKIDEDSNWHISIQLLASEAANDPNVTEFPPGCEDIARRLLIKCKGCLLAVRILGMALSEVQKTPKEWAKVEKHFRYYFDESNLVPSDYESSRSLYATIALSLYYGREKDSSVGMENVLRALSLFDAVGIWLMPEDSMLAAVEFAWHCLQPPEAMGCFDVYLQDLVRKGLVEIQTNIVETTCLCIDDLVREFIAMKLKPVNLHMGEDVRTEILAFYVAIYGGKQIRENTISLSYPIPPDLEKYLSDLLVRAQAVALVDDSLANALEHLIQFMANATGRYPSQFGIHYWTDWDNFWNSHLALNRFNFWRKWITEGKLWDE